MSTPTFHFIGGKGGVGKTTCAAAIATGAAAAGGRVLVLSTDPAPSLSDAFAVPLSAAARRIPLPAGRLFAAELDAAASLRRWLNGRRATLEAIAIEGSWLDREDVESLLRLSLPGIDEVAALLEIAALAHDDRFDLVVVDTAPTGHTLRMLAMPEVLFGLAEVFETMRERRRVMEEALTGGWRPAREDHLIHELAGIASELEALLRDPAHTQLSWVTLPEPMAIAESADAMAALRSFGIPVTRTIVNRLTRPPAEPCGHCDARVRFETEALAALPPASRVQSVAARDTEPRGIAALASIADELGRRTGKRSPRRRRTHWTATLDGVPLEPSALAGERTRLVLLGGKGGVGKTTAAAALALALAARHPARRVLLISTDPAHSLADAFGVPLNDAGMPLPGGPGNLLARELDSETVFARLRQTYVAAVDELFDRLRGASAFDAAHDRAVIRRLIDLAPPGLDELAAIMDVVQGLGVGHAAADLVVMDTAPTGHALRLLEMPGLVHDWTRALMSIVLKYQHVFGVGTLGALLLTLSKNIRRLRELLADGDITSFIVVTRPATLPRLETVRLVRRLTDMGVSVPAVVINAVGRGTCPSCTRQAAAQSRAAAAIRRALSQPPGDRLILHAPASIPPPRGLPALTHWMRGWHVPSAAGRRGRGISSKP